MDRTRVMDPTTEHSGANMNVGHVLVQKSWKHIFVVNLRHQAMELRYKHVLAALSSTEPFINC